jgi:hypothetical protein
MRIAVQADEGDEVSIVADFVSVEQGVITLEIENALYKSGLEIEAVTLTIEKARELATAILSVADAVEFVSTPVSLLETNGSSRGACGNAATFYTKVQRVIRPLETAVSNTA